MNTADLLLHRSPERTRFYSSTTPLVWSEQLGSWMTANRELILSILKDRSFVVVDFRGETRRLAEGLGLDLRATEAMFDQLPLAQEGAEHSSTRRRGAQAIKRSSSEAIDRFAEVLEPRVRSSFARNDAFNIVSEVLAPSLQALIVALSGLQIEADDEDTSPSLIFDRMLSVNRRKRIDRRIDAAIRGRATGCPIDEATMSAAIAVVGSDSLLGALTESFVHEVEGNPERRLSEFVWSDKLPRTGVPYVDRIATKPTALAGSRVEPGQRLRLFLDALRLSGGDETDYYFGAGRHVCLGKAVSIQAWHILTAELARIEKRIRITEVQYRKSDFVFNTPTLVEVSVEHE